MAETITCEELKKLVDYNPDTGEMCWRVNCPRTRIGDVVGRDDDGYRRCKLNGRNYYVHRLAWLYMTGSWPTEYVDHRNGVRSDNTWSNLREASREENGRNRSMARSNKSGYKGVQRRGKRWVARIGGRQGVGQEVIGWFHSPEEAAKAYETAAKARYGDFSLTKRT